MIGYIIGGTILNLIRLRGKPKPSQAQYIQEYRAVIEEFEAKVERMRS
jgi:hypothetical protein